jgi:Protein of unknown function (DUF2778)
MQSQQRRRFFTFIVIAAAGAICGFPWSANAVVHSASHARAAAAEAAAFVAPALKEAKQALKSKIDAQLVSSTKSAGQYLQSLRKTSDALAASLLSQSAPPMSKPGGASPAPALNAYPALDSVLTDSAESRTAVYDISARTVYLPDGRQLEAHSGLGKFRDDVRSVKEKNRGVTPPNVYDLTLREQPFHGVQALRLTPVSESPMYGRDGILAHTYMLGTTGQSNGCVVFKDYPAFLQAYLSGQVSRLVVVTSTTAALPAKMRLAGR